ncbi:MAG: helix-turn-helix transcriptional regulator [Clostridia bacterium]|nr:helix-turn-helix transcriptional regulator [Clostridia bacterium]
MNYKSVERRFSIKGFYSAFRFAWDEHFVFHGESHDLWEIVYLDTGRTEVTEDEKIYTLEGHNMILHAPMEFHRIKSAAGTSPTGFIMTFATEGKLPTELRKGIFELDDAGRAEYRDLCERVIHFLENDELPAYEGQEIADLLSAFLIRLGAETAQRRPDTSPPATEYRKVVSAMAKSVCDNKTLADFARECNISVSYIKQLFKKYAGISPKTYYTNLRVQHATKLLKGERALSEIAEEMNFSSPNYFSVFFKKHMGVMPSEYKKGL